MLRRLAALLWLVSVPAAAQDRPFGIAMGQPVASLELAEPQTDLRRWNRRFTIRVPEPDPEFATYLVTATAEHGVCRVGAIGMPHDPEGARRAFRKQAEALTAAFGPSVNQVDLYDPPTDLDSTRALGARGARVLGWEARPGTRFAPGGPIASIALSITLQNASYIAISYEFANGCPSVRTFGISLITARVSAVGEPRKLASCPSPRNCPRWRRHRFDSVRVLAGEAVPASIASELLGTPRWEPGDTVAVLVRRDPNGSFFFRDSTRVRRGRACLATEWLGHGEIVTPGPAWEEGARTCFRVPD